MAVTNVRDEARKLVDRLPDGATWDDLEYEIYVRRAIEAGIADSDAGAVDSVAYVRKSYGLLEKFPVGWDANRAQHLIDHYEALSEDEMAAEDEAAVEERPGQAVIAVPDDLLPAIRQLLAGHKSIVP